MKRLYLIIALCLLCSFINGCWGCTERYWYKEGLNFPQFEKDKYDCEHEEQAGSIERYYKCMESKGYTIVRKK